MKTFTLRPPITLGEVERHRLLVLAMGGIGHKPEDSDYLLYEVERARIVPDASLRTDIVRMGSRVRYCTNTDRIYEVTLVYPKQADISEGRISVLTPVGTALIGLRKGQSITWITRNGAKNVLTVLDVWQLEPDPEPNMEA